jgi:hypothetical protein
LRAKISQKHPPFSNLVKHIRPKADLAEISAVLEAAVASGSFGDEHLAILRVTDQTLIATNWTSFTSSVRQRLDAGTNAACAEVQSLLPALRELAGAGRGEAQSAIDDLGGNGHLLHYLHKADSEGNPICSAECAFAFLSLRPNGEKPPAVGNSDVGLKALNKKHLANPDQDFCSAFYGTVMKVGSHLWLFKLIDARDKIDPLVAWCLRRLADEEHPEAKFSSETLIKRWNEYRDALVDSEHPERFSQLVCSLSNESDLVSHLQSQPFSIDKVELYRAASQGSAEKSPEFGRWCRRGISEQPTDTWKFDFQGGFLLTRFALEQIEKNEPIPLGTAFEDSVVDYAKEVANGSQMPPDDIVRRWDQLLDSISEIATRKVLTDRIVDTAVESNGKVSEGFIALFRKDLTNVDALVSNERIVSHLFSPIVRERNVPGLKWLQEFLVENSSFLDRVSSEHTIQEFENRLRECIHNQQGGEADGLIRSIAQLLNITPQTSEVDAAVRDSGSPS